MGVTHTSPRGYGRNPVKHGHYHSKGGLIIGTHKGPKYGKHAHARKR